jgi:hypothetical protein
LRARRIKRYSEVNVAAEAGQETVGICVEKKGGVVEGKLSQNSWEFVDYSFRSRSPSFKVKEAMAVFWL